MDLGGRVLSPAIRDLASAHLGICAPHSRAGAPSYAGCMASLRVSPCIRAPSRPAFLASTRGPFNLLSSNGQIVATSEPYNAKASAMGGVRSIKREGIAADAEVEDRTTKK